jgi:hypothetical protein
LSYNYQAPNITPQGTILPMQALDASLKKDVLKGKGNLSVRVSDVFNTRQFAIRTTGVNFTDEFVRKRESRIFFATFTYRFGSMENISKKSNKKSGGREDGGTGGGTDDMQ